VPTCAESGDGLKHEDSSVFLDGTFDKMHYNCDGFDYGKIFLNISLVFFLFMPHYATIEGNINKEKT
jgi:hypothetical protein